MKKDVYAKLICPGEDGSKVFSAEIGLSNGEEPRPLDVAFMLIKILEDFVVDHEITTKERSKVFLKNVIDSNYAIERMETN